jgi:hypothetical protein
VKESVDALPLIGRRRFEPDIQETACLDELCRW